MTGSAPRRSVLAAALAAAASSAAAPRAAALPRGGAPTGPHAMTFVHNHAWTTRLDWLAGTAQGTRTSSGGRPGIVIERPSGTIVYRDPHTGTTGRWEAATWTSPIHWLRRGATELVVSWNAHNPPGTWLQVAVRSSYNDGSVTPWYVMGRWASGDEDVKRTSVDCQSDGRSTVSTDTLSITGSASRRLRLNSYRLRVTLHRRPRTRVTPVVWRVGAMVSDLPSRFTVPGTVASVATGVELRVPHYSQEIHKGQYPEYDNGGEAWCSPTSTQMALEYFGHRPSRRDLAWVDPAYADPQVCHAARATYDYQYSGCGNWPFNAAYAATYPGLAAAVTRLRSLADVERLIRAGIPVITSQSFLAGELYGAGYGTAGHLMCVVGFTGRGDIIANDPAAPDDASVRRVYRRGEFETVWLRTKRYGSDGKVTSGTGGIAYLYWPTRPSAAQRAALGHFGLW